jgi:Ca2+-binding RTX toxin-like protein
MGRIGLAVAVASVSAAFCAGPASAAGLTTIQAYVNGPGDPPIAPTTGFVGLNALDSGNHDLVLTGVSATQVEVDDAGSVLVPIPTPSNPLGAGVGLCVPVIDHATCHFLTASSGTVQAVHAQMLFAGGDDRLRTSGLAAVAAYGAAGDDDLEGGAGREHLNGGDGNDVMSGAGGSDDIEARDGEVDEVSCGSGTDSVYADFIDVVAADCENVNLF